MNRADSTFDEYTLAAFMAGSLSDERRQEVIAYLAENAEARELLVMAYQALDASEDGTPLPFDVPAFPQATPQPVAPAPDRAPRVQDRTARRFTWKRMSRYAATFVVVFALGVSLRLVVGPPTSDTSSDFPGPVRDGTEQVGLNLTFEQDLIFSWNALEEANEYRLVVMDVATAEIMANHTTKANRLDSNDAFIQSLKTQLTPGKTYSLSIDARDMANNPLLKDAIETVNFTLPQ